MFELRHCALLELLSIKFKEFKTENEKLPTQV